MTIGRKMCRDCHRRAADGWHISKNGLCRPCAVSRAAEMASSMFPQDPPESPELAAVHRMIGERSRSATDDDAFVAAG